MMLIAFAIGAWVIVLANQATAGYPDNWFTYISPIIFSVLAYLYWRHLESAAFITVMLFAIIIAISQPEPFVTQYGSLLVFFPPVLALVLLTPRWVVIASFTTILILLARANWQGVYANPLFLAIYITLIGGLLISRRVLDLNSRQLAALNRTLEQRITERTSDLQNALAELRTSDERLRTVATNAPLILFGINQQAIFTVAEGRGLALLEIEPNEVIGQSVFELFADRQEIIADLHRALAGESFSCIRTMREYTFETWYAPLYDANGNVDGITAVSINITVRQRAEEELARSLKFAQSINNATPDIVYVYNLHTNETFSSNRSPLTILGYTPEQIEHLGTEFFLKVAHPDDIHLLQKQYNHLAVLADGDIFASEYRLRTAGGVWRWFSSREIIFQRRPDGTPELIFGIETDITERKIAEAKIRKHSEELVQANIELARAARLKDEFLANMSHELRTPLTSILGRSELLQDDLSGPLTEFQRRSVRGIEESGRHLLELINDILDLSKIEAGKLVLEIQPIPMAGLVHSCIRMIAETAKRKQLRVDTTLDPAVAIIDADPRRLKQILVNLLGNAVKFTPNGGEVGLEVCGNIAANAVDLIVWDTGIGIDSSDQTHLFQPFVQIDSGLTRQYEGTGLGLALVERLTKLHGGSVSLVSELGKGSRFIVSLPWQPSSSPALVAALPPEDRAIPDIHVNGDAPLILLVEDNPETRTMIAEYLTMRGYRVAQAQTGHDALIDAHAEPPALIIMDIQLPDMDGLTATRTLRADPPGTNIPILVLSAHAMPGDREQSLAAGANAYLSKPVRLTELVTTIKTLI